MGLNPRDRDEVREAIGRLRAGGQRAIVVGGGTSLGLTGRSDGRVRLEMGAVERIIHHEPADLTCTVEAGATLARVKGTLNASGQTLPVWHPEPERATIGGLIASGWIGPGSAFYGKLRDRVLEVHAVTGSGKLIRGGGKVVKNVTGFDLPRLFSGSFGTLGVLVEVTLKVQPDIAELFMVRAEDDEPRRLATKLRGGLEAAAMPLEAVLVADGGRCEGYVFAPGPAVDAEALLAPFQAGAPTQGGTAFVGLGTDPLLCPDTTGAWGEALVCRAAVPPAQIGDVVGRIGDGGRMLVDLASGVAWFTEASVPRVRTTRELCEERGGSLVVLHATPDARREVGTWGGSPSGSEIMRRLKAQFDPDGILPGLPVGSIEE